MKTAIKFGGSGAIPSPTASMTTPSALMVTKVVVRMCVEGFEMPDDGNGNGSWVHFITL